MTHEIGCGGDALRIAVDMATDVNNLLSKEDACSNTAAIVMQDSAVGSNVKMADMGTQNIAKTQDAGSDCFKTQTSNVGTQNERNMKDQDSHCELIIPDEEEAIQQESI